MQLSGAPVPDAAEHGEQLLSWCRRKRMWESFGTLKIQTHINFTPCLLKMLPKVNDWPPRVNQNCRSIATEKGPFKDMTFISSIVQIMAHTNKD